jgi:hypothetical protein
MDMRKITYKVTTPKGTVEVRSLARANEIVAEKGGTFTPVLREITSEAPVISELKMAFLKSKAKPLNPYRPL